MKLQTTWIIPVVLLLPAGFVGYGDEPQAISDRPKLAERPFHQLPKNGTSAYFTMDFTEEKRGDMAHPRKGSVTMSSVGQTTVKGRVCRWIEVKVILQIEQEHTRLELWKVLIPEEHLEAGRDPIEGVVKGWHFDHSVFVPPAEGGIDFKSKPSIGADEASLTELAELEDELRHRVLYRLTCFAPWFCGPLKNVKKLDKAVVESGIGRLECEGITGEVAFPISKPAKTQMHVSVQKRLHEMAPFGIVSSQTRMWFVGRNMLGGTIKLKLMEIGKNAESQLPKW